MIVFYSKASFCAGDFDYTNLILKSHLIVKAEITDKSSEWIEDRNGKHIYTHVQANIIDFIKGNTQERSLRFRIIGGQVGNIREVVSYAPHFQIGENAILFLNVDPIRLNGESNGKIKIHNDKIYFPKGELDYLTYKKSVTRFLQKPTTRFSIEPLIKREVPSIKAPSDQGGGRVPSTQVRNEKKAAKTDVQQNIAPMDRGGGQVHSAPVKTGDKIAKPVAKKTTAPIDLGGGQVSPGEIPDTLKKY
jgi:hypothetical protein